MSEKVKVLIIINRLTLGGPIYNAAFLSAFLTDKFEVKLIGGKNESYEVESLFILKKYNVYPQIIDNLQREINFKKDRQAYKDIRAVIRDYKPDIVHTHASKTGVIGRLAAFKENVPVVIHTFHGHVFHSYFGKIKTLLYKTIERYLAKKSSGIIAISNLQENELVNVHKVVPKNKSKVIYLGFDLTKFQTNQDKKRFNFVTEYNIQEDEICIGIIGRLTSIKNHEMFFNVINEVVKLTTKKIRVFIIGGGELDGELKKKAQEIEKINKQSIFTFTSWIKDIDIPLARLDIICLTSYNEGTPVCLIEAQAANIVVMSTNVGGVKDIVDENNTAFIIEDLSVKEYTEKLLILIEDEKKRNFMSQKGWNYVKDKFHYTRLCSNMEEFYLEKLENKK